MSNKHRIAFLGLGSMGRLMAGRLVDAGYPLTVWNRSPSRAEPLVAKGARAAATPAEAAVGSDVVFLMLSDPAAVATVLTGANGVLDGVRDGAIVVDCSTIAPADSRTFADRCRASGVRYVESPVLGSLGQAESGTLVAIAAGDPAAVEAVEPLLRLIAKQVVRVGEPGRGSALKLTMNLLVGGITELLAESLEFAERVGLARDAVRETLMSSVLSSPFVGYKAPQLLERTYTPPLFSLKLMKKDLDLVLSTAHEHGLPLPATRAIREQYESAAERGFGDQDFAAVRESLTVAADA